MSSAVHLSLIIIVFFCYLTSESFVEYSWLIWMWCRISESQFRLFKLCGTHQGQAAQSVVSTHMNVRFSWHTRVSNLYGSCRVSYIMCTSHLRVGGRDINIGATTHWWLLFKKNVCTFPRWYDWLSAADLAYSGKLKEIETYSQIYQSSNTMINSDVYAQTWILLSATKHVGSGRVDCTYFWWQLHIYVECVAIYLECKSSECLITAVEFAVKCLQFRLQFKTNFVRGSYVDFLKFWDRLGSWELAT